MRFGARILNWTPLPGIIVVKATVQLRIRANFALRAKPVFLGEFGCDGFRRSIMERSACGRAERSAVLAMTDVNPPKAPWSVRLTTSGGRSVYSRTIVRLSNCKADNS